MSSIASILQPDQPSGYGADCSFDSGSDADDARTSRRTLSRSEKQAHIGYISKALGTHNNVSVYAPIGHSTPYADPLSGSAFANDLNPVRGKQQHSDLTSGNTTAVHQKDSHAGAQSVPNSPKILETPLERGSRYDTTIDPADHSPSLRGRTVKSPLETSVKGDPRPPASIATTLEPSERVSASLHSTSQLMTPVVSPIGGSVEMLDGFLAFVRSHPHGEELFRQYERQWDLNEQNLNVNTNEREQPIHQYQNLNTNEPEPPVQHHGSNLSRKVSHSLFDGSSRSSDDIRTHDGQADPLEQLIGSEAPITPEALSAISKERYEFLHLEEIDRMSLTGSRNMIKNIALLFDIPYEDFPASMTSIAKLIGREDAYLHFANNIHRVIYDGNDMFWEGDHTAEMDCLRTMTQVVKELWERTGGPERLDD